MAKTSMICPFSRKLCVECELYRGRHYFLCFCEKYRGHIGQSKGQAKYDAAALTINFKALETMANPWVGENQQPKDEPEIKLKVVDMENKQERLCQLEETKTWDWGNPKIMRIIDGRHVTNWYNLLEILNYKAKKGYQEVELHEGPRFILLSGG
jgi:hypothetical protein